MIAFFSIILGTCILYAQSEKVKKVSKSNTGLFKLAGVPTWIAGVLLLAALVLCILKHGWVKGMIFSFLQFTLVSSLFILLFPYFLQFEKK